MNKRIQKKVHKRLEHDAEQLANEAVAATGERLSRNPVEFVREGAARVKQALRDGDPRAAVRAVQERAGEAIDQVKGAVREKLSATEKQVKDKLHETEQRVKDKLEQTEQRAEALLDKVPVVGAAAAKKLHGLTHS
jgi:gas vesicle protein